jgi:hypothetical protein
MSESILLTGKRGSGKTLAAIDMARKYLERGSVVATNLNLYLEKLCPAYCQTRAYRLPDYPSAADLRSLPLGNRFLEWREGETDPVMLGGFTESANGFLLLDEVATFLNAREWQGSARQEVINWLVQSRKYGWDICLIVQHSNMLDKQIREALIELQGVVRRLDKICVPLLSPICKYFTGRPLHFPKIHFVSLLYGFGQGAPLAERWFFYGKENYGAYDTLQRISPLTGEKCMSVMLSAYELKGRYMSKWGLQRRMAAGGLVIGCLIGGVVGVLSSWYVLQGMVRPVTDNVAKQEFVTEMPIGIKLRAVVKDSKTRLLLSDGSFVIADGLRQGVKGAEYKAGGNWYVYE